MCRSIKQLRQPDSLPSDADIHAAALQFVRKVSGYRAPSRANREAFEAAVDEIAEATHRLIACVSNAQERPSRQPVGTVPPDQS